MTDLNEQSGRDDQVPRAELAAIVDHTLLKTDATPDQVSALLDEAKALRAFSICVSPNMLPVQGDAGVRPPVPGYLEALHLLCERGEGRG